MRRESLTCSELQKLEKAAPPMLIQLTLLHAYSQHIFHRPFRFHSKRNSVSVTDSMCSLNTYSVSNLDQIQQPFVRCVLVLDSRVCRANWKIQCSQYCANVERYAQKFMFADKTKNTGLEQSLSISVLSVAIRWFRFGSVAVAFQ